MPRRCPGCSRSDTRPSGAGGAAGPAARRTPPYRGAWLSGYALRLRPGPLIGLLEHDFPRESLAHHLLCFRLLFVRQNLQDLLVGLLAVLRQLLALAPACSVALMISSNALRASSCRSLNLATCSSVSLSALTTSGRVSRWRRPGDLQRDLLRGQLRCSAERVSSRNFLLVASSSSNFASRLPSLPS